MDTRTNQTYPSKDAALQAGVPEEHVIEIVTMTSGPFKGRSYELLSSGRKGKRVYPKKEESSDTGVKSGEPNV